MAAADSVVAVLGLWTALALVSGQWFPSPLAAAPWLLAVAVATTLGFAWYFGLYNAVVRYLGPRAVAQVGKAVLGSSLSLWLLALAWGAALPPNAGPVYALILLAAVGGLRFEARNLLRNAHGALRSGQRTLIYGAGAAGVEVAFSLEHDLAYRPVAFVDDCIGLHDKLVAHYPVYAPRALPDLIERYGISLVLLAMPSASRRRRLEIVAGLEPLPVQVKTLPGLGDLVSGRAQVNDIGEIQIEDLLGRDPVVPDAELLGGTITGRTVMVTGAGGSVGSELCRQIAANGPRSLVLFERNESALFAIEQELLAVAAVADGRVAVVAILGSVVNRSLLVRVMRHFGVDTVYHAAAYKHVPLVEHNVIVALRNNVVGTWHCGEAAIEAGVERFILVSTDKAVRPTNVMGATKRFAELVLQGLQDRGLRVGVKTPVFTMVRFGNVLGSSGSVVPKFRAQIRAGGPVTVTHADITRYFMTTPEAAQLVIQAGTLAAGGEVFVLDMGEPVRILDLAHRMVRLAGLTVKTEQCPDGDIEIVFNGLRPGEKLYEELLIGDDAAPTRHPKVRRVREPGLAWKELDLLLKALTGVCDAYNVVEGRRLLEHAVREYQAADRFYDYLSDCPALEPVAATH